MLLIPYHQLLICSLLVDPNPKDPLIHEIAELLIQNKDIHDANTRDYTFKYANSD